MDLASTRVTILIERITSVTEIISTLGNSAVLADRVIWCSNFNRLGKYAQCQPYVL